MIGMSSNKSPLLLGEGVRGGLDAIFALLLYLNQRRPHKRLGRRWIVAFGLRAPEQRLLDDRPPLGILCCRPGCRLWLGANRSRANGIERAAKRQDGERLIMARRQPVGVFDASTPVGIQQLARRRA